MSPSNGGIPPRYVNFSATKTRRAEPDRVIKTSKRQAADADKFVRYGAKLRFSRKGKPKAAGLSRAAPKAQRISKTQPREKIQRGSCHGAIYHAEGISASSIAIKQQIRAVVSAKTQCRYENKIAEDATIK